MSKAMSCRRSRASTSRATARASSSPKPATAPRSTPSSPRITRSATCCRITTFCTLHVTPLRLFKHFYGQTRVVARSFSNVGDIDIVTGKYSQVRSSFEKPEQVGCLLNVGTGKRRHCAVTAYLIDNEHAISFDNADQLVDQASNVVRFVEDIFKEN